MRSPICGLFVLALAAILAGVCSTDAQDKKKPGPGGVFSLPKQVKLTDEQQKKIDELEKDYLPKLEEFAKKEGAILTAETKKQLKEINTARAKMIAEIKMSMTNLLTDEQKEALKPKKASPFAATFSLPKQIKLTDEQQKKIDELEKDYLPKLEEFVKKQDAMMKEINTARAKMIAEIRASMTSLLTDEQKEALKPKKKGK